MLKIKCHTQWVCHKHNNVLLHSLARYTHRHEPYSHRAYPQRHLTKSLFGTKWEREKRRKNEESKERKPFQRQNEAKINRWAYKTKYDWMESIFCCRLSFCVCIITHAMASHIWYSLRIRIVLTMDEDEHKQICSQTRIQPIFNTIRTTNGCRTNVFHSVICHSIANNNIFILQFAPFGATISLYWSIYRGHELNIILSILCWCKRKIDDKIYRIDRRHPGTLVCWAPSENGNAEWPVPETTGTVGSKTACSDLSLSLCAYAHYWFSGHSEQVVIMFMCAAAFGELIHGLGLGSSIFCERHESWHTVAISNMNINTRNMHIF